MAADKTNLKKRGSTWHARYIVPHRMRERYGREEKCRSLRTASLAEANRLKRRVLIALEDEVLAECDMPSTNPADTEWVLDRLASLRESARAGEAERGGRK